MKTAMDRSVFAIGAVVGAFVCGGAMAQETVTEDALVQSPALQDDDDFGHGLAVNDDYLVIGAPDEDPSGVWGGVVRVYDRDSGALLHTINSPATNGFSEFGRTVALSDDGMIAVLMFSFEYEAGMRRRVRMYDASTGAFVREIVKPEPLYNDTFGDSIAINGDYVVVGDYGRDGVEQNEGEVFVYERSTGNLLHRWSSDAPVRYTSFGHAIALEGSTVLVYSNDEVEHEPGVIAANVVWVYDAVSGARTGAFYPSDDGMGEEPRFSPSIAVQNGLVVIGSGTDDEVGQYLGAVYVFHLSTGSMMRKILPPVLDGSRLFLGGQVALDGNVLVASATGIDTPSYESGGAFVFDVWSGGLIARMESSVGALPPENLFPQNIGFRVAVNGDRVWASTAQRQVRPDSKQDNGLGPNAVYVFSIPQCEADVNGDGALDYFDLSYLLQVEPDLNGDTVFDFFDVSAFLNAFNAGCP
jgi:hypothetical protein